MRNFVKRMRVFCVAPVLLLSACVSMQEPSQNAFSNKLASQQKLASWRASGALGVKTAQQGFSADYVWQYQPQNYQLELFGPLGAWHAQVFGQGEKASLQTSQGEHLASEQVSSYMKEKLGWSLPVSLMSHWLVGLPAQKIPYDYKLNAAQQLIELHQQGWLIQYDDFHNFAGTVLARRVVLSQPGVSIKVIIQDWQSLVLMKGN